MIDSYRLVVFLTLAVAPVLALADDVSIYGSANVEMGSYRDKRPRAEQIGDFQSVRLADNSRGRFGVKAAEDLGHGVAALARFEWNVSTVSNRSAADTSLDPATVETSSDAALTGRMAYVGLAGGLGVIMAGNLKSPYKYTGGVKYDPFTTTSLEARGNGAMSGGYLGHEDFLDHTVGYVSPEAPVRGRIVYGAQDNDNLLAMDLLYRNAGFEAFVAYMDSGKRLDPEEIPLDYKAFKLGAQYRSANEAHIFSAQYEYVEDDKDGQKVRPRVWFLGYQFVVGNAVFALQGGRSGAASQTTIRSDYAALGAIFKFSRQTRLYTGYRFTKDVEDVFTVGLRKDFKT